MNARLMSIIAANVRQTMINTKMLHQIASASSTAT